MEGALAGGERKGSPRESSPEHYSDLRAERFVSCKMSMGLRDDLKWDDLRDLINEVSSALLLRRPDASALRGIHPRQAFSM